MTFSLVARCAETGMFKDGKRIPYHIAMAARCAYARSDVGAEAKILQILR